MTSQRTATKASGCLRQLPVALCLGAVLGPLAARADAQVLPIEFNINQGQVVPTETFAAKISVLGAAVSASGAYDCPVTVLVNVGTETLELFGPYDRPVDGNVNDGQIRNKVLNTMYDPGKEITVTGQVWVKKNSNKSGASNNDWKSYAEVSSHGQTANVWVLRDGDGVPSVPGFSNQAGIQYFIQPYISPANGTVSLDPNQAIYLFEFADVNSSAADFQDLVVLVTLGKSPLDVALQGTRLEICD